jgi:hypothetical protein
VASKFCRCVTYLPTCDTTTILKMTLFITTLLITTILIMMSLLIMTILITLNMGDVTYNDNTNHWLDDFTYNSKIKKIYAIQHLLML